MVDVPGDGEYLFKVNQEKSAAPDQTQLDAIKANAFKNWYAQKKDAVTITRDLLPAASATG